MKAMDKLQKQSIQIFSASGVIQATVYKDGNQYYTTEYLNKQPANTIASKVRQHKRTLSVFNKPN